MVPLAEKLRADVKAACGVTCSVGLAPNRLLAKLASEEKKPDGLFATPFEPQAIREFLAPKSLKILWGVGGKTAALLERYGYRTCADIQNADPRFLERILGESAAASIRSHAHGIDFSTVAHEEEEEKSISREHTFPEDETDREKVRATLLALVEDVGGRFRTERRWAHTAKLKLRDGMFNTITRQATFARPARDDMTFRHLILDIFDREWPEGTKRAVRLIGFGVTNFTSTPESAQPDLFGESSADDERMRKRERLAAALDAIRAKRNTKL
jgi:DNA polymerase-4